MSWPYLRQDKPLLALTILGLIFVPLGMPYLKLMPVFVRDNLDGSSSLLGLIVGGASLGTALAGLSIAALGDIAHKGYVVLTASTIFGIGLATFAFVRHPFVAVALIFIIGALSGAYLTISNVLLLTQSPDNLRGRVMGMWGMVWGLVPLTTLITGAAVEHWGISAVFVFLGSVVAAACVLMMFTQKSAFVRL